MNDLHNEYRICALYSGSTGNATLIETPGAKILIDAGKSARALTVALSAVNVDIDEIDAIFITHDHTDHIRALPNLIKKHPIPVHAVQASAQVIAYGASAELTASLHCHPPLYTESVGDITIRSFITPHDSVFSVGYRIAFCDGQGREHAIGFATDIGYISEDVRAGLYGCESVVLESNHDYDMLMAGPYPPQLKARILSRYGHLSNEACGAFASELSQHGTKNFILAHLSEQNNLPDLAYNEVRAALGDDSLTLLVAEPATPVTLCVAMEEQKCLL